MKHAKSLDVPTALAGVVICHFRVIEFAKCLWRKNMLSKQQNNELLGYSTKINTRKKIVAQYTKLSRTKLQTGCQLTLSGDSPSAVSAENKLKMNR